MASADDQIAEILKRYSEPFQGNVWRVQGTAVIYHKTLERIAASAKIRFDPPQILRAERDEAVIVVTGRMGEQVEWSIGEALINVNYRVSGKQAAYVYAMAEKRAKDRVILKLIGLHGLLYSEEEADEFRARAAAPPQASEDEGEHPSQGYIVEAERRIASAADRPTLLTWWNSDDRKQCCRDFELSDDEVRALHSKVKAKADALQARVAA